MSEHELRSDRLDAGIQRPLPRRRVGDPHLGRQLAPGRLVRGQLAGRHRLDGLLATGGPRLTPEAAAYAVGGSWNCPPGGQHPATVISTVSGTTWRCSGPAGSLARRLGVTCWGSRGDQCSDRSEAPPQRDDRPVAQHVKRRRHPPERHLSVVTLSDWLGWKGQWGKWPRSLIPVPLAGVCVRLRRSTKGCWAPAGRGQPSRVESIGCVVTYASRRRSSARQF